MMKPFGFILLFALLLGCQASEPGLDANPAKTEPAPPAQTQTSSSQDNFFSVRFAAPEQVKVNTTFSLEAELKNTADQTFEIITGEPVFYYVIQDSEGNADPIVRTDIGVMRPIDPDDVIQEKHPYRFKTPGVYEVSAVAEFTLQGADDNPQAYKLETDRKRIEVIE
ncbi:hypothetical protein [Paenibacillus phocaensis]|uniref:hypothetical protein n=1 Tax=Paenibacillus phocaensis TaxID=1776378 RepID=UPI0018E28C71|nr:hypothetical protein [Paenibacillus phocaensis]